MLMSLTSASADFTVNLSAGRLRIDQSAPLPHVGNVSPSDDGSLLLLIAAGGDGEFSNELQPGTYVSGNDVVLAAGGFNTFGGTDEARTSFIASTGGAPPTAGDRIALHHNQGGVRCSRGHTVGFPLNIEDLAIAEGFGSLLQRLCLGFQCMAARVGVPPGRHG